MMICADFRLKNMIMVETTGAMKNNDRIGWAVGIRRMRQLEYEGYDMSHTLT